MSATPPGWYPDPYRRHESRFWDGGRWTEHVSDAGAPSVDPTSWGPAPDSPPLLPEPEPAPASPQAPPTWGAPPPPAGQPAWGPAAVVDTADRLPAIVGLAAAAVLLVSAFLPWFRISVDFGAATISQTVSGTDGSDGAVVILLAIVGGGLALLRVLGKAPPQVGIGMAVVGLLAAVLGFVDLGNKDPNTDAPLAALADITPSVGLWLVILAGLVLAVAGGLVFIAGRSRPAPA